jgi:hexosaminidase
VQANVWTIAMASEQDVESMTFPRGAALAEIGWSPPTRLRWSAFQERLAAQMARYPSLGVRHSDASFRVQAIQRGVSRDRVSIELAKQVPLGEIRYTLNGSEPNAKSSPYSDVLEIEVPATLKATSFYNGVALSLPVTLHLDKDALAQGSR